MQLKADQETSLLDLLKKIAPDSSSSTLRSWISKRRVTVNGQLVARSDHRVLRGQEVKVGPNTHFIRGSIKILFEDEHLVVLEKPEGLLSVATDFQNYTVHDILKKRFRDKRVYPVHRLDRETSGVMIFAYTEEARDRIKEQFEERKVDKVYYAVVEGKLAEKKGVWKSYLKETGVFHVKSTPWENEGKLAISHYEVVSQKGGYSLLKLNPETGRKNQLRVHCLDAGHPIAGDRKYGATSNPIKRVCLHARSIRFQHPVTRKSLFFELPLPATFSRLFKN